MEGCTVENLSPALPVKVELSMASDDLHQDLDIPQIAIVDVLGDSPFLSAPSRPSILLDSSRLPPSSSPTDNHGPPSLTPILRSTRNSLDTFGSPSRTSDNASLPTTPSPTLSAHSPASTSGNSIRWASSTVLARKSRPEEHYGLTSSYLAPLRCCHRRKGSAASSIGTRSETGGHACSFRAADSDLTAHTRARAIHVDAHLDPGSSAGLRPSSVTSFFRRTVRRVRRPSGGSSDTSSDATRNGGQKGDNADVRRKGAQLAPPVQLDLKQEADLFFFQKASTVLDMEKRLEVAKKLHEDAVDLQMYYESGTVAAMRDLRATGNSVPIVT